MTLRELDEKGIRPSITWHIHHNQYYAMVTGYANADYHIGYFDTFKEAEGAIINYAITNLIKGNG